MDDTRQGLGTFSSESVAVRLTATASDGTKYDK
jgi:hypothetical protein